MEGMQVRLKIREAAEARGLNPSRLARRADLTERALQKIWNDPILDVRISTVAKIALALGTSVSSLIEIGVPSYRVFPDGRARPAYRELPDGSLVPAYRELPDGTLVPISDDEI